MALIIARINIQVSANVKTVFFLMFRFAIGFGVGPQFVRPIRRGRSSCSSSSRSPSRSGSGWTRIAAAGKESLGNRFDTWLAAHAGGDGGMLPKKAVDFCVGELGFDAPLWSMHASLTNLSDAAYETIAQKFEAVVGEYAAARESEEKEKATLSVVR